MAGRFGAERLGCPIRRRRGQAGDEGLPLLQVVVAAARSLGWGRRAGRPCSVRLVAPDHARRADTDGDVFSTPGDPACRHRRTRLRGSGPGGAPRAVAGGTLLVPGTEQVTVPHIFSAGLLPAPICWSPPG